VPRLIGAAVCPRRDRARRPARRDVEVSRMWPFRTRAQRPDLVAESDPVRHELLQSQLRDTLTYGWRDSGRDDAVEFFRSLPPTDDASDITERLGGTSPPGWSTGG
jgi:hypothetical protein